jgi:PAS domain S-box-containing protein
LLGKEAMSGNDDQRTLTNEEEALARLAAIVQSSDDAIIGKTLAGIVTSWNRGAEKIYGYSAQEAVGRHISFLAPPESVDEMAQLMERVRQGEQVYNLETERVTKSGRLIEVSLTISPVLDPGGALIGFATIARDITERTRLQRLLQESEHRYQSQIEMTPDAVIVHQGERFVYANCAALGIYGATSLKQLQQVAVLELIHPDDREAVRDRIQRLLEGEEIALLEFRLLRLDGQIVPVEVSSVVIDYHGGPCIQVIARDITERKRAEQERERLHRELDFERARFETVVSQMPVGVMIAEAATGRMTYSNQASHRICRQEFPNAAGFPDGSNCRFFHLDGSPLPVAEHPMSRALRQGETVIDLELQVERGDGTLGFVSVNAAPIKDPSGAIVSGVAIFSDITERTVAAEALRQSDERLNLALDASGMGACDMDLRTGAGLWSQQHFLLLGYQPPASGAGQASLEMWQGRIHPDDRPQVEQALEQAQRGHSLCRSEHRILRADDSRTVWVSVLGHFTYDRTGQAVKFIGVIFDETERKLAEEKLRESELRHRLLFETSLQGIVFHDARDRIILANPAIQRILGRGSHELLGKTVPELGLRLEREDGTPFPEAEIPCTLSMKTGKKVREIIIKISRPHNGDFRWLSISSVPLFRAGAESPYQVYATIEDITSRKLAEEALRASEAKFRWLFESNLIAIFFWDKEGKVTEANQAYCDLVGYSPAECQSGQLNWLDSTPPDQYDRDFAAVEEIRAHGFCKPYQKEFLNRKDGRRVPVLSAGARMFGTESAGMGFAIDLSELKRAELAVQESEATLKLAVETTGLGTFDWDLVTGKESWSEIAKRHYGLPPDAEVDAVSCQSGIHPEDRDRVLRQRDQALSPAGGGRFSAKYRTIGIRDGKERWISSRGQTLFNERGEAIRLVGACLDITDIVLAETALKDEIAERLRAVEEMHKQEQLLIRQGRLAALGEMIGNIAHQWRQPLNTLALIIQELPWNFDHDQFSKEYLDASVTRAMQVINHMSKTIDGFRNFLEPNK